MNWRKKITLPALATLALIATSPVTSAAGQMELNLNESQYFETHSPITRIAIGSPEVADVTKIDKRHILIIGKKVGSTTLIVWTEDGMMQDFEVGVMVDDTYMAKHIEKLIGLPDVHVQKAGRYILLYGFVKDQIEYDWAERVASLYNLDEDSKQNAEIGIGTSRTQTTSGSESENIEKGEDVQQIYTLNNGSTKVLGVINKLEMRQPAQIEIEAKIIDINIANSKNLGFQYGSPGTINNLGYEVTSSHEETSIDANGNSKATSVETKTPETRTVDLTAGTFFGGESFPGMHHTGSWILDHIAHIDATINALVSKGDAKILSRPNTVTLSGREAGILIGGQIPVMTTNVNGSTNTEWHDYGIKLKIKPEVDSQGMITANIYAGVSTLDQSNAVAVPNSDGTVPAIATREATATVNIPAGMTMAIGGLLSSTDEKTITKFPILGDIPIIGEFFKHTSRSKGQRELIILITPRLITPMTPVRMGEKMKEKYEQIAKDDEKRTEVNLNPTPEVEPPEQPKPNESLIEKYLDRKALPKPDKR